MLLVSPDAGTVIYAVDGDRLQRQRYDDSEAELQALVDTFQVRDFGIRCKTFSIEEMLLSSGLNCGLTV